MKKKLYQNDIYVQKSRTHGYGVFAGKTIRKGSMLEECYMIITKGGDRVLEDYYFDVKGKYGIFTGYGIIYNHADEPNADYFINSRTRIVTFKAAETIPKGKEIFISYGKKWFTSRGIKPKKTD